MVEPLADRSIGGFGQPVWTVAALLLAVGDALAARFPVTAVRGEISGFARAASGHCYFNLKDADGGTALLRCAMFRRAASLLDFAPGDGQQVELRGRVVVYEARGELQLVVESMQRAGAGALYEQFLRLKARLEAEGLFDAARKRAIAGFPRAVGVISSLAAAALRDVLTTLQRRSPHVHIVVYPSLVQGGEAPRALVDALATAARRDEVDTLIVCRGGGALEDLWSFNDERVVRAIAASPIPVVCGVGHETDLTLADLAADLRAPTPTAAAELVAPPTAQCGDALNALLRRARRLLEHRLDQQAQRLDGIALRLARPAEAVRQRRQHLALLQQRLASSVAREAERRTTRLAQLHDRLKRAASVARRGEQVRVAALADRLRALDPQQVLERGYAWLSDDSGRLLQSVRQLQPQTLLRATLADGQAELEVLRVQPDGSPPA